MVHLPKPKNYWSDVNILASLFKWPTVLESSKSKSIIGSTIRCELNHKHRISRLFSAEHTDHQDNKHDKVIPLNLILPKEQD